MLVLSATVLVTGLLVWLDREPRAEGDSWFRNAVGEQPPDDEVRAVAAWLGARVLRGVVAEPPILTAPRERVVFVTLSDGEGPPEVALAKGDMVVAAERAVALAEARRAGRQWRWLKLDVVVEVGEPVAVGDRASLEFERGLDGLAFDAIPGLAFLPEEVLVRTLVNSDSELRARNIGRYLTATGSELAGVFDRLRRRGDTSVRRFRTRSFFVEEGRLVSLYRGHRELTRATAEELLRAARSAGDYLRRAVTESGLFVYAYLPKTDDEKDDYNMLRHAGTAYAMYESLAADPDPQLLAAAELATDFLRRQVVECGIGMETASCVEEDGYVKLGGNALAILALAQRAATTPDPTALPLMQRLARWMTASQRESGEFSIHKQHLATGTIDDFISQYYPGEALFALTRLHELDRDPKWLDSAERGAEYLIVERDADLSDDELSHDHWLLYALNELHRLRPRELYLEHALRLARVIADSQNRDAAFPDWRGSYYRPPRSTPTATRSEGLSAAYDLATRAGRTREATEILEAVRLGVEFQLQLQFRPESALYLPNPPRALGGFPRSLTNFEIRIDYVQHNLSSLLALGRILGAESGSG